MDDGDAEVDPEALDTDDEDADFDIDESSDGGFPWHGIVPEQSD